MAVTLRKRQAPPGDMPIAPMIDVVFLLLIYFMVGATLQKQEADIAFQLPGVVEQTEPIDLPDEQIIEITESGQVVVNEFPYDSPGSPRLLELAGMLSRFKEASVANKIEPLVTIAPHDSVPHQIIVRVMDACSVAEVTSVNFSFSLEE
jgi:biopolymer transport protein ExbD